MSATKTAFPVERGVLERGMSLRDYFAAEALQGVMAVCVHDAKHGMSNADYFAGRAYEIADAMLKAREAT